MKRHANEEKYWWPQKLLPVNLLAFIQTKWSQTENPNMKYVTMAFLPPDYSAVQQAADASIHWIQSPSGVSLSTEKFFLQLRSLSWQTACTNEKAANASLGNNDPWHSHCASGAMQPVLCKHPQTDLCMSKANFVVQTVKLILLYLDLAWHKWKIITLKTLSEVKSKVACKGKVGCGQWQAVREGKRDSPTSFSSIVGLDGFKNKNSIETNKWPGDKQSNLNMFSLGYLPEVIYQLQYARIAYKHPTPPHRANSSGLPTHNVN